MCSSGQVGRSYCAILRMNGGCSSMALHSATVMGIVTVDDVVLGKKVE